MSWSEKERVRLFEEELLPLFQELIQNACVNDGRKESGQEVRSANSLIKYLGQSGIACRKWEPLPGRVSILAELQGNPGSPTLMLMGHTDVVPARAEDWDHPPFEAEIHAGQVWGRGTVDMLCWTVSQAVAFAAHARSKDSPRTWGLKYLAVADEEAAGTYGARFLTDQHWDRVKCDAMVTELGGFYVKGKNGLSAVLTLAEKGVCWLKLTWKGRAGHGSMPYGSDNALLKAAKAAEILASWKAEVDESPLMLSMRESMRVNDNPDILGQLSAGSAGFLHTAERTTISPNILRSGEKANIIPDRAELVLDIRFLEKDCPGSNAASVIALVKTILGPELGDSCDAEVIDFFPPNSSPSEGPVPQAILKVLQSYSPEAHLMPTRIGGVTDGRYWRSKGIPVYGFLLFEPDMGIADYSSRIHSANERISLASLRRNLDFFLDLPFLLK